MEHRLFGKPAARTRVGLLSAAFLLMFVQAAGAQGRGGLTQNPLAGSLVFGAKGCVKCHAINGLGGSAGPDLGRIARRRSFYELATTMWNHLPEMGAKMREYGIERPQMSQREAGDLIAFLFTLDYFDPPGDVETGRRLFTEKKCVVCHQVGVYGGVIGPNLDYLSQYGSPILVAAAMWNHGPTMSELMVERGIERPRFDGTELNDLIAYLESAAAEPLEGPLYVLPGNAEEGRVIFVENQCRECHSVRGVGGRVGPDLVARGDTRGLTEFAAAMWNKAPAMTAAMRARGIDVPQLGGGEMADLVAYLYSVQYFADAGDAEAGHRALAAGGCLRCHSLSGTGGESAGDLAQVVELDSPAAVIASLWNHSTLMEAGAAGLEVEWAPLNPEEMADIMAFLVAMAGG
ncbi:MAG: c-type cytochrome [Gemmatimonadales bacterium]